MRNRKKYFVGLLLLPILGLVFTQPCFAKNTATGKAEKNALFEHASPYLAMHGRDPVRWLDWNEKTIELARKQDKLLFVSSGYFSCHWCHVMQRESYQNDKVAALLNKHFIPVKVDRELNSALDAHLIDFVERTQGQAGWPLNTFITPDGYPLVGLTYAPAENFLQILTGLEKEWRERKKELKDLARAASVELSTAEVSASSKLPSELAQGMMDIFVNQSFSYSDDMQGGYGQQNKFPSVPKLDTLLTIYQRKPNEQIKQFLNVTLRNMASQGLQDQLGGGFYRYVVDPGWQVPHFEKMLYDNALLASLYYKAAIILEHPAYKDIADATLNFIMRDLDTASTAFAASLSAVDDKGIEGGYYLWQKAQLKHLLTEEEQQVIIPIWGLEGAPDLDDGHHLVEVTNIPDLARELKRSVQNIARLLESARDKMLKARAKRVLPKDAKVLTAWNGLALSAFVEGAQQKGNTRYKNQAAKLVNYFKRQLWDDKSKVLRRAVDERDSNRSLGDGTIEDYAYVAQGLFAWWQLEKNPDDKIFLEKILEQAWSRFYSKEGWRLAENMLLKYGAGQTMVSDSPLPSPSAVIIETSYQYALQTNNKKLKNQALRALNVGFKQLQADGFWYATQIKAIMSVQK